MQNTPEHISASFNAWDPSVFSFIVFAVLAAGLVAALLALSTIIMRRKDEGEKGRPYECGVIPSGSAQLSYPAPFWLVAVFFLLFDVEAVYVVSWAVSFKNLTWASWAQMTFFIGVLLLGLFWVWRKGGLEWGMKKKH
ncbi:NADH-quinone oxidoreductase subunit A [Desulfovibrio gilichinskyi]|uniref:NADH-quinone oxidoreductase subunit A n=1 Tax=Desulfovibrio gilichinskyi TaxID=1519643 RepID=A0A1X7DDH1_9BACT|nr:NADH-quinone oxidoreductase subunit A [Desulfovibrio gilichinskyi]SMF13422.1 NADH dehydrogenase subunit A [Desulfovibrio gilichinskyi]